ncbi:hypothetical protein QH494_06040 [Sphingomonas sp. AR_OL41]|uniref:hypothetical protein n=1 Tax=Sphingomonas sp. AR_OL41 TaxID=3042729 RepID=UPI00248072C7|nr:hypothetical protein [Sphingomonas sp. AR_OL41]MDH7971738.1 hypothetical protein [Sphingomonas sp. AR_OL41]
MADDVLTEYKQGLWAGRFGNYDDEMLQSWCDRVTQAATPPSAVDEVALAELDRRRGVGKENGPT